MVVAVIYANSLLACIDRSCFYQRVLLDRAGVCILPVDCLWIKWLFPIKHFYPSLKTFLSSVDFSVFPHAQFPRPFLPLTISPHECPPSKWTFPAMPLSPCLEFPHWWTIPTCTVFPIPYVPLPSKLSFLHMLLSPISVCKTKALHADTRSRLMTSY